MQILANICLGLVRYKMNLSAVGGTDLRRLDEARDGTGRVGSGTGRSF